MIAEAEAGLGREVAGAQAANGIGLGRRPSRGAGTWRAGRCGLARVPALPHPRRARAPAAGPPHRSSSRSPAAACW